MSQDIRQYDFFVDGKLDLRKLRHDMNSALSVMQNMLDLSAKYPQRRKAEFDPLLQEAVDRLRQFIGALHSRGNLVDTVDKH